MTCIGNTYGEELAFEKCPPAALVTIHEHGERLQGAIGSKADENGDQSHIEGCEFGYKANDTHLFSSANSNNRPGKPLGRGERQGRNKE